MAFKEEKRLKNKYDKFNKLWFDGALPSDVRIGWSDELPDDRMALTVAVHEEETKHTIFTIYLNIRLMDWGTTITDMTILHEQCHCHLYPYMKHGRRFEEEMVRLALRGAFKGLW